MKDKLTIQSNELCITALHPLGCEAPGIDSFQITTEKI